ncbi:hypothetical protein DV736_g3882, partial [Chaetothyriales sp. CBS 134916]
MEGTTTTTTIPPKFSRYRSVRKKNSQSAFASAGVEPQVQLGASRALAPTEPPSRYRRRNNELKPTTRTVLAVAPAAENSAFVSNYENGRWKEQGHHERADAPVAPAQPSADTPSSSLTHISTVSPMEAAREEARMILEGEYDRLQKLKQRQKRDQQMPEVRRRRKPMGPEHEYRLPEQDDARAEISRSRSRRHPPAYQPTPPDSIEAEPPAQSAQPSRTRSHVRYRIIGGGASVSNNSSSTKSNDHRDPNGPPASHQRVSKRPAIIPLPQIDAPNLNKPARPRNPKPAPAFDAPVSAINAANRQVAVACNKSTITLPVIPTTTAKDLLNRASELMTENIDARTAILLESFSQLRLERPLRRYERIRDVMNGWDNDTQNRLVIMSASECAAADLEVADAPASKPDGVTVRMYHSSRPGHWTKKWVRLREDGQMCVSSKESFADSNSTNICHLSDFDLYTPTSKQRRSLRSPKKICFAVKSQEKSSAFLNGQNFVHFFASNAQDVANEWYTAVWGWRSWYLADVLGEGTDNKKLLKGESHSLRRSLDAGSPNCRPFSASSNSPAHYKLGSFKPLVDFNEFRLGMDDRATSNVDRPISRRGSFEVRRLPSLNGKNNGPTSPRRPTTSGAKAPLPPSSFPRRFVLEAANVDHIVEPASTDDEAFTGKGLLARHASTKSQHGKTTGRGVKGKEGQPLLDLTKESEFADGSLLHKLEAQKLANSNDGASGKKGASWVDWD